MRDIPNNWFEDFFHGLALDLWRRAIPPEHTNAEADFLAKNLGCESGAHVLDVPCGNGRLSFELAKRGYRVTGVDIADEFIEEARVIAARSNDPSAHAAALLDINLGAKVRQVIKTARSHDGSRAVAVEREKPHAGHAFEVNIGANVQFMSRAEAGYCRQVRREGSDVPHRERNDSDPCA